MCYSASICSAENRWIFRQEHADGYHLLGLCKDFWLRWQQHPSRQTEGIQCLWSIFKLVEELPEWAGPTCCGWWCRLTMSPFVTVTTLMAYTLISESPSLAPSLGTPTSITSSPRPTSSSGFWRGPALSQRTSMWGGRSTCLWWSPSSATPHKCGPQTSTRWRRSFKGEPRWIVHQTRVDEMSYKERLVKLNFLPLVLGRNWRI